MKGIEKVERLDGDGPPELRTKYEEVWKEVEEAEGEWVRFTMVDKEAVKKLRNAARGHRKLAVQVCERGLDLYIRIKGINGE